MRDLSPSAPAGPLFVAAAVAPRSSERVAPAVEKAAESDNDRFSTYRKTGELSLRNELVEEHLNLARSFARRYRHRGVALDDLEQVALMNLIAAVERFDPSFGVRFSTFAGRTIDGALKRHFRDHAWAVKVPRHYQELSVALRAALERLTAELGRVPSTSELAIDLGAETNDVRAALEASHAFRAESIDSPPSSNGTARQLVARLGAPDDGEQRVDERDLVADLLGRLPDRERAIVERRYFREQSQRAIAAEVGMSQVHVSRLLRKALVTLRTSAEAS
ncbi:MAG: sigma-70 family RNA polymerase sigma factor [Acidimicrobiales bacterium]